MMKKYRVIHPYLSYAGEVPVLIPVGTIGDWNEAAQAYMFQVGEITVPVLGWMLEILHRNFEVVE